MAEGRIVPPVSVLVVLIGASLGATAFSPGPCGANPHAETVSESDGDNGVATLTGLRAWTAPDHTRIVLDLTAPAVFDSVTRAVPSRNEEFVLRLPRVQLGPVLDWEEINDGVVRAIDVEVQGDGIAVVVGLDGAQRCEVFAVEPFGEKPERLMIDVIRRAPPPPPEPPGSELRRVVIDPGHGGDDGGAVGYGLTEKMLTLDISRRITRVLNDSPQPIRASLTRDGDYYLSLARRTMVTKAHRADLFVSIHVNSAPSSRAHGAEIYFLSMSGATDQAAEELAHKENAADLVGGTSPTAKRDLLASDDILGIVLDVTQAETLERSSNLAESIVDSFRWANDIRERGVKQAGFAVLKSIVVPSVLIEVGFVSNRKEAQKLSQAWYRQRLAEAIAFGVERFLADEEGWQVLEYYEVRGGDTLSELARRHRISVEKLAQINGIEVGPIRTGQTLRVPR